jgi:hypothetical protein
VVVFMQRAQPHPSAATEGPRRLPIMRLQIAHQGNLLFQVVESLTIHGLLASTGRIRQAAPRSQARMVGARKKRAPIALALTQQHTLSRRRCAHRRRVDGSGERDGSLQCGAACFNGIAGANVLTGLLAAAHAEMRRRRQPIGQDGKGLAARLTKFRVAPRSSRGMGRVPACAAGHGR